MHDFREDLRRYPRHSWLLQPSLWAICVYRFGRWARTPAKVFQPGLTGVYFVMYSVIRLLTGIDIPRSVSIGPGLMIHHFGGVIVNPRARIGRNCTLRHGVTIGNRTSDLDAPTIGDNVEVGAYAQILGNVTIGSNARIGALTLIIADVPDGRTFVGIPGRDIG